jgi:DNA-binding PucR family transcriptional regulator
MGQDTDALILASKRLAVELQALTERARKLAAQQVEILQALKRPQRKT